MTFVAIHADFVLAAVKKARDLRNPSRPADAAPIARLSMLEDMAKFVSKDRRAGTSNEMNVGLEDFSLIANSL